MRITDVLRVKGTRVVTINPDMKVRALLDVLAEHGIGAVIVSHDGISIDGIASEHPTTLSQLREIQGIGDKKLEHYGADILAIVNG